MKFSIRVYPNKPTVNESETLVFDDHDSMLKDQYELRHVRVNTETKKIIANITLGMVAKDDVKRIARAS